MATREQLERALINADAAGDVEAAKALASAIQNLPTLGSEAKAVGSQALYAVPTFIGALSDLGAAGLKKLGDLTGLEHPGKNIFPLREGVTKPSDVFTQTIGTPKEPQTPAGKMTAEAAKGAVMGVGMAGPAIRAVPRLAGSAAFSGATGGVGGEVAANAFEDSPWARILGGLIGGLGGGLVYRAGESAASGLKLGASPQTGNRLQKGLEGVTSEELDQASRGMARSTAQGFPTTIPQNIPRPTGLQGLQDEITGSEHGAGLTRFLSLQDEGAAQAARRGVANLGPGMPPQQAAEKGADAARGHLEGLRQQQMQNTAPFYEKITPQPPGTGGAAITAAQQMRDAADQMGQNSPAYTALMRAANALHNPKTNYVATETSQIDSVRQALRDELQKKAGFTAQQLDAGMAPLNNLYGTLVRDLPGGNAMHAAFERTVLEPARRSPAGQLATEADTAGRVSQLGNLLGTSGGTKAQSILRLQGQLHGQDPEAFPAMARAWMSQQAEKHLVTGKGGMLDPEGAGKFANAIGGTPGSATRENFRALIAGVARSRGTDEASAVAGAERWLEALRSTQGGKQGMPNWRPDFGSAGENAAAAMAGYHLQAAPQSLLRSLGEIWHGKSSREIADVLMSPDGVKYLQTLAKLPRNPRTTAVIRATMGNVVMDSKEE